MVVILMPMSTPLPPGGLERFRLAACGPSQAEMRLCFGCFGYYLSNDDTLGSGDVVP